MKSYESGQDSLLLTISIDGFFFKYSNEEYTDVIIWQIASTAYISFPYKQPILSFVC